MTDIVTLTLWLLLAVVQQHGSIAMTFGTQEECRAARDKLVPASETVALSQCVPLELVRFHEGQPMRAPRIAP